MDTAMNVALTNPSNPKYTQQMFGAVVKSYYAQLLDVDPPGSTVSPSCPA